jgi:hypothetical protein
MAVATTVPQIAVDFGHERSWEEGQMTEDDEGIPFLLSVKTHRRVATGNTRSREASGTAGGPRSLGQRPKSPAHALAC